MNIEELNTVETSVETWLDFCKISMESEFYKVVLERSDDPARAAALTLFRNYISTFSEEERTRLESDVEYFYKYALGFIDELAPYRYNKGHYNQEVRAAFLGKIKALLAAQKNSEGELLDKNQFEFIRTIVHFCSSLDFIIKIHDDYKTFLFREWPQIQKTTDLT